MEIFYALVLMLLTEAAVSVYFFNYHTKLAPNINKFVPNSTKKVHNLHHGRKLMQIRCHKGADTKMHNV